MNGQTCPITMTEFNEASQILEIRECRHIFNENALRRWFRNHVTCPVCRCDIRRTNNQTENTEQVTDLDTEPLPNPPERNRDADSANNADSAANANTATNVDNAATANNFDRIYYDVFIDTIPLNTTNLNDRETNNTDIVNNISNIFDQMINQMNTSTGIANSDTPANGDTADGDEMSQVD